MVLLLHGFVSIISLKMNKEFIKEVGVAKWIWRTTQRQFFKRILRRDHFLNLPFGEKLMLPISSKFASEVFVTQGNVDWGAKRFCISCLKVKASF